VHLRRVGMCTMFRVSRLSQRFFASTAAASATAVAFGSCKAKFAACADDPPKKLGGKKVNLEDFEMFHAYQVHFTDDATTPLTKTDLIEILLHCGILDPAISDFLFNSLEAMDKKKRKKDGVKAKPTEGEKTVTFASFKSLCSIFAKGDDLAKWEVMFDFMDPDKSGMADKNEISVAVRHLLWCQTNWYGEEVLYDGPIDLDLFFDVPTEAIAQLKANKLAHDLVVGCHGGGRQAAVNKKQFMQWMGSGGKKVETLKGLFSVFGAYEAPTFHNDDE
jgi:Ca2+-binding EF-hand superfamily protein